MVEAAPQAQPKTTWNAQKDFVQLRVLLETFSNVLIISARFPFPCQKRFFFGVFLGSFFRWFFGTPFGGQRVAQGGRFEALFLTFWVPFWAPHFGIVF